MRVLVAVLCLLLVAAPAAADEPSGAERVTLLTDLIDLIEAEIAFYETAAYSTAFEASIPGLDLAERREAKVLRADAYLGFFRSRASDFLHEALPEDAAHFLLDLDPMLDATAVAALLDASGLPSDSVWAAAAVAEDWTRFQHSLLRLRDLVEPGSPERVCPIKAPTWFQNEWEVPRPWGRIHKGVDMHTDLGIRLYAIEDGTVIQANWHRLGGRQVYLRADSTGDVYYYAHLDFWPKWLWSGTRLEAGDYLGLAGRSGNATTPHLHLGWMPGSGQVELDNLQNPYYLMYELCF
jgi:murein DD-endopeptidase MepM/ murein hydrolase activator NlpD